MHHDHTFPSMEAPEPRPPEIPRLRQSPPPGERAQYAAGELTGERAAAAGPRETPRENRKVTVQNPLILAKSYPSSI